MLFCLQSTKLQRSFEGHGRSQELGANGSSLRFSVLPHQILSFQDGNYGKVIFLEELFNVKWVLGSVQGWHSAVWLCSAQMHILCLGFLGGKKNPQDMATVTGDRSCSEAVLSPQLFGFSSCHGTSASTRGNRRASGAGWPIPVLGFGCNCPRQVPTVLYPFIPRRWRSWVIWGKGFAKVCVPGEINQSWGQQGQLSVCLGTAGDRSPDLAPVRYSANPLSFLDLHWVLVGRGWKRTWGSSEFCCRHWLH